MAAKSLDKILCGAALLVLLSSLGWIFSQKGKHDSTHRLAQEKGLLAPYVPANLSEMQVSTKAWPTPGSQSGGTEWVYDVLTPPEIYYDAVSKQFTVTPPSGKPKEVVKVVEPPFGVELLQVKEDTFRLQLVGYTGKDGNYKGTFENTVSGKTILGQAGRKIADLNLTIVSFEVKQNRIKQAVGMDVIETEAVAQISDDKTGETYNLTNKTRLTKGAPIAYFKVEGSDQQLEHKAGDTFTVNDARFTVASVSLEPSEVVVTKEAPSLTEPLTKTLTVKVPAETAPASASASPFGL